GHVWLLLHRVVLAAQRTDGSFPSSDVALLHSLHVNVRPLLQIPAHDFASVSRCALSFPGPRRPPPSPPGAPPAPPAPPPRRPPICGMAARSSSLSWPSPSVSKRFMNSSRLKRGRSPPGPASAPGPRPPPGDPAAPRLAGL